MSRFVLLSILGLACAPRATTSPPPAPWERVSEPTPLSKAATIRGFMALALGELAEAERAFARALLFDPGGLTPMVGHGQALLALGRVDEAKAVLGEALGAGAEVVAPRALGEALFKVGAAEEALGVLHRWSLTASAPAVEHAERARLALVLGAEDEARESLTAAIQGGVRDPALITAWVGLVAARPGEGIGVIEAAAQAAPADVALNLALLQLAWRAGDARAAQIALWRLEEPPEEPTALVTRWLSRPPEEVRRLAAFAPEDRPCVLMAGEDCAWTTAWFKEEVMILNDPSGAKEGVGAALVAVEALLNQGAWAEAEAASQALLSQAPGWPPALLALGRAQLGGGDVQAALVTLGEAVALRPHWPGALVGWSEALAAAGRRAEARAALERAARSPAAPPTTRAALASFGALP
ncbi:MAG: tetratricopeptide repeat protein [Deltaproteobacteria bacterium]|nr:tetratricopeptide repeat protein [Deltaproteobacteria bacterium]